MINLLYTYVVDEKEAAVATGADLDIFNGRRRSTALVAKFFPDYPMRTKFFI